MDEITKDLDDGLVQETDYVVSGESPILMTLIKALPKLDNDLRVWNQYVHKRHNDSCTKFWGYNAWCTQFNHNGSWEEIDKVEEKSLEMGRPGLGHGRSSSKGGDAVRKVMNDLYPQKKVSKWYYDFDSDAHEILKEKHRPMNVSIVVDSEYWKQSKNGRITGTSFKKNYGHADTVCIWNGNEYTMIESVGGRLVKISKDVWDKLVENGNIRKFGYVLLPIDPSTLPEGSVNTFAEIKKRMTEKLNKRKETQRYVILKGPVVKGPKRILKTEPITKRDGKIFVNYRGEEHQIVKNLEELFK